MYLVSEVPLRDLSNNHVRHEPRLQSLNNASLTSSEWNQSIQGVPILSNTTRLKLLVVIVGSELAPENCLGLELRVLPTVHKSTEDLGETKLRIVLP